MMKTRQDNDMIDYTGAFYAEKVLNFHDRSNWVQSTTNTRQDNDVTD